MSVGFKLFLREEQLRREEVCAIGAQAEPAREAVDGFGVGRKPFRVSEAGGVRNEVSQLDEAILRPREVSTPSTGSQ